MDDVTFGRMAMREGWTFNLLPVAALRYRGEVWYLWMPCYTYDKIYKKKIEAYVQ